MDFAEKLARLTEGKNKQSVGKRAGLAPTTVSDYIAKGSSPKADKALSLARVLGVPLDWLVDDARGWPPPKSQSFHPSSLSDRELMMEVASRHRRAVLDHLAAMSVANAIDWTAAAIAAERTPIDKPLPEIARRARIAADAVSASFERMQNDFDLHQLSVLAHDSLPGADRSLAEIEYAQTAFPFGNLRNRDDLQRFLKAAHARPDYKASEAAKRLRETDDRLVEYYRRRRALEEPDKMKGKAPRGKI